MTRKPSSFSIDDLTKKKLEKLAEHQRRSMSAVVCVLVDQEFAKVFMTEAEFLKKYIPETVTYPEVGK